MTKHYGTIAGLAVALGALLVLAPPGRSAEPRRGGSVVFTLGADPDGLNRNIASDANSGLVACIIYQGLTRIGGDGDIKPELAKSWTISPDGLTYSFALNKADWQDGKPFTSDDVKYTLLDVSAKYSAVFASSGRAIDTIDTPAPDRVIIHLKYPYGPFLRALTCLNGGGILPAHVFRGTDVLKNPANAAPVGLGPFLLKEWNRGSDLRLERNPNYWQKGKPYLDELIAKIIPQASSRTQALLAGDVDFVSFYFLATNDEKIIKAQKQLELLPSKVAPSIGFLAFNVTRPVLADRRVRQALFMATDRDYLVKTAYQGNGYVATMPFTDRIKWADDPKINYNKMYPFDVAKANALLDAAGKPRGPDGTRFKLTFVYNSADPDFALVATAIKFMWSKVGVDVTIVGLESTTANQRMFVARDFDVTTTNYTSFGDPALGMARLALTSSIGKPFGNPSGYSNPEVDALFEKGAQAVGEQQRGKYYQQAQDILAKDLPFLTVHEEVDYDAMSRSIHDVDDEDMYFTWRNAWRDK